MQRRLSYLILIALLAACALPDGGIRAATFRSRVAQVPAAPSPSSTVRVWMNSDTVIGETAVLEYVIDGQYTKVLGTYDTSYPGANWYADIPPQAAGKPVSYQILTRNQSGGDYGFSGFNWSYVVSGQSCAGASVGDNTIFYAGLLHDSFAAAYRSAPGPVTSAQGSVTLRLRTCQSDAAQVSLRVWNDRTNSETLVPMAAAGDATDPDLGPVSYWSADLSIPAEPTVLYYIFRATDGTATAYYRDDSPQFLGGGYGQADADQGSAEANSFQLTVYDPAFAVPGWLQRGIIYQIFPDRFRDGDSANNPAPGGFFYGANTTIARSGQSAWNSAVCDPRGVQQPACPDRYSDNFYGGDLKGITQKIEEGYFDSLGVSVLYLNPIFRSPSNHRYDTADYLAIDPALGSLADFEAMVAAANAHGIHILLDGVFNHVSSDSTYFDRYQRYNAAGSLTSPGVGANDGSGACEAASSPYRSWFYLPAIGAPAEDTDGSTAYCNPQLTYESWYGYSSLPKLQANSPAVRSLIWSNGLGSVGPYWTKKGVSGWRFDVGGDVDPGLTNNPANDYWEGFRAAVRDVGVTGRGDTAMLGEEWGDASPWLLGGEWDSVMNYRFRSAVLGWLFTGCTGSGCAGGASFQDNDSNANSSSGAISALPPSLFNTRLRSIQEDYPPAAFKAMMNLSGSHDTSRIRFLLKKINNDSDSAAVQRLKELWLFAFTYAGAPTLYYGDEVGLSQDDSWSGTTWEDDPYNRAPFPWPDADGSAFTPDTAGLLPHLRKLASIRQSYRALQDGDVQHGLIIDDANKLYGYARTNGSQTALVALNRDGGAHTATFSGLNAAPYNLSDGTVLLDALNGGTATVSGGQVSLTVNPSWGVVLLEQAKIAAPAAPANLSRSVSGADIRLSWPPVTLDTGAERAVATAYRIYRGSAPGFTPAPGNLIATVTPPAFGGAGGLSYTDAGAAGQSFFYRAVAVSGAGSASAPSAAVGADEAPPNTSITSQPANPSTSASATFVFTGSDDLTPPGELTFECKLDSAAFAPCSSPQNYGGLALGGHTFQVRAVDQAGLTDPSPDSFTWQINAPPADPRDPDTAILTKPAAVTRSLTATFTFNGTDDATPPGSLTFECRLDGAPFAPCASPQTYTSLTQGSHLFEVRAIDGESRADQSPASYTWVVDTTPPDTTLPTKPTAISASDSAFFVFGGSDNVTPPGSLTFECRLDGAPFAPCGTQKNYSSLAQGSHTFEVRATDQAGNTDPTPLSFTWVVDTIAPETTLLTHPPLATNQTTASFTFSGSDTGTGITTFQCSLDGAPFAACTSPWNLTGLAEGPHTFQVRAQDNAGTKDPTPESFTWYVDLTAPDTAIVTKPLSPTYGLLATFSFSATDNLTGTVTFECSLDGGAFAACANPSTFTGLAPGGHTIAVRARDAAGNLDPSPASYAWFINPGTRVYLPLVKR
jgi:glycosidase